MGEKIWGHLATEAVQAISRGDVDDTVVDILCSFTSEGVRRGWNAADESTPLGAVASAVAFEWRRNVACDGELEDPIHEPLPIPATAERRLRDVFQDLPQQVPL